MGNELNIKLEIQSVLKDKGLIDAKARVEALEKEVTSLSKELDKSAGSARATMAEFAKFAAGAGILAFAKNAVTEFANVERQFNAIGFVMRRLGIDAGAELPKVREFLEGIARSGGPLVAETVPVFQKFLGITKSVPAALAATKLATDAAETGSIDMASAFDGLAAILQGKVKGAANALGLEVNDLNGKQKTHVALLEEAIRNYQGLGDAMSDARNDLDKMNAALEQSNHRFGALAASVLPTISRTLIAAASGLDWFAHRESEVLTTLGERLAHLFDLKSLVGDPKQWWSEFDAITKRSLDRWGKESDGIWEKWAKWYDDTAQSETARGERAAEIEKGISALKAQAHRADMKADEEESKALLAERERIQAKLKQEEEQALKEDQERAKARIDLEKGIVRAGIDAAAEGSSEKMVLELKYLDIEEREAKAKYADVKGAQQKIEEQFQIARMTLVKRYNEQLFLDELQRYKDLKDAESEYQKSVLDGRMQDSRAAYNADIKGEYDAKRDQRKLDYENRERELATAVVKETSIQGKSDADRKAAWAKYDSLRKANNQSYNNDVRQLNREEMEANKEKYLTLGSMAVGAITSIFGNSKAGAVANAIMSTYEAADKALALGGPYLGPILAALMIAAGMANVEKIMDTEPTTGKGFDDPKNDAYARQFGGRKWARDLVDQIGMGFREELSTLSPFGGGPGAVTNNSESYVRHGDTFVFNGLLIDDRNLKQAARLVRRGERLDQARRPR